MVPTQEQIEAAVSYLRAALAYRPEVGEAFDFEGAVHLTTALDAIASLQVENEKLEAEIIYMEAEGIDKQEYIDHLKESVLVEQTYSDHMYEEITRLKAEVERKDKALALALPFLCEAARESIGAGYAAISATESLAPLPEVAQERVKG